MPEPSRGLQISRRRWLLAGLAAPLFTARADSPLIVTYDGDNLHVSSLGVHFLQNGSLKRLKEEGSTVEYVLTISLYRDAYLTTMRRSEAHFFVSYDVLGQSDQFAVSTREPRALHRTNLSLSAAETWCLDHTAIAPPPGYDKSAQFWLQLDTRSVPPKLGPVLGSDGLSIDFIELLTPGQDERQQHRTGPLRLRDLPGTAGRGRAG